MVAAGSITSASHHHAGASGVRWWRYVDGTHAHEVVATWSGDGRALRIRESSPGSRDAAVEETILVHAPWEAQVALWQLRARLAALGRYWEQDAMDPTWRPLASDARSPDPRENRVLGNATTLVHHYHDRLGGDELVAALSGPASRHVVLRARLDIPNLDVHRIDVLHQGLPTALMRSLVLREQLALAQPGRQKLVHPGDYVRAYGPDGDRHAGRLFDEVIARVNEGQLDLPTRRLEDSDIYAEFLVTVHDPRLRALHLRFLAAGEEDALLQEGPRAIRRSILEKRAAVGHEAQHLLTILEASLLARERMKRGQLVGSDSEVRALARLAYYL